MSIKIPTIHSEEWTHVRHVPSGNKWHDAEDFLAGTEVYGDVNDDTKSWSKKFDHMFFSNFLFTTGDRSMWILI